MTSISDEGVAFCTEFRAKGLHFCRPLVSPQPASQPTDQPTWHPARQPPSPSWKSSICYNVCCSKTLPADRCTSPTPTDAISNEGVAFCTVRLLFLAKGSHFRLNINPKAQRRAGKRYGPGCFPMSSCGPFLHEGTHFRRYF